MRQLLITCIGDHRTAHVDLQEGDASSLVDSLLYAGDCGFVLVVDHSPGGERTPLLKAEDVGEFFAGGRDT